MNDKVSAAIAAIVVGAFFLWHGEWAARQIRTKRACEAIGYHDYTVTLGLRPLCATTIDGARVFFELEAARPGEIDG